MYRSDYISWDDFFMGVAELASKRSKDPDTRCGAVIVDTQNRIVSVGYNGLPRGMDDAPVPYFFGYTDFPPNDDNYCDPWKKPEKNEFSVHAEQNALFNCNCNLTGCSMFLFSDKNYLPCSWCARGIVQKGIISIVIPFPVKHASDKYNWSYTKHMFTKANVQIRDIQYSALHDL